MKMRYRLLIGIMVLSLIGLICKLILPKNEKSVLDELKTLDKVDQIRIFHDDTSTGEGYLVKTIEDPKKINSIVEIFRTYADGWEYGHFPASPPGPLTVEFYKKKELIAMVDVTHYIQASGDASFYLSKFPGPNRPLEEREFKELISILEIDEDLAQSNPTAH